MSDTNLTLLQTRLDHLTQWGIQLRRTQDLLKTRLLSQVTPGMAGRSDGVSVDNIQFTVSPKNEILGCWAKTQTPGSSGGVYQTRLSFQPPSHRCSCPDWDKRQHACKHVIALAYVSDSTFEAQVRDVAETIKTVHSMVHEALDSATVTLTVSVAALAG